MITPPIVAEVWGDFHAFVVRFILPYAITVVFFDKYGREFLQYDFKEIQKSKLVLNKAIHKSFKQEGEDIRSSKTFAFDNGEEVLIVDRDHLSGKTKKFRANADLSKITESYPEFLEYDPLFQLQRGS